MLIKVDRTSQFIKWLKKISDRRAKAIISNPIDRMEDGNFGDHKSVGGGVWEKRINYARGYRLYYCQVEKMWVMLLCGGDKTTQKQDMEDGKKPEKGL